MADKKKLEPVVLGTIRIENWEYRSNAGEALKKAEELGLRPVTVNEAYELIKENRSFFRKVIKLDDSGLSNKYANAFPCVTSTYLKYNGTDCEITENGRTVRKQIPAKSGWYETDEFGLPFGKPSTEDNPTARLLLRANEFEGYVSAGGGINSNERLRVILAGGVWELDNPSVRGVIAVEKEKQALPDSIKQDSINQHSSLLGRVPKKIHALEDAKQDPPRRKKQFA